MHQIQAATGGNIPGPGNNHIKYYYMSVTAGPVNITIIL